MLEDEPINPEIYSANDEEDDDKNRANYNFDVDDVAAASQADQQIIALSKEEQNQLENEILFYAQGVGNIKKVGEFDVYVKNEHCEESIRDLIKAIKQENAKLPVTRQTLGKWNFLQQHLIPILIFHQQDKKLSFLTVMLLVQLTEMPNQDCENKPKLEIIQHLQDYKETFLLPKVVSSLMTHLADCLQVDEKTQKHNQMIELIIVLFKQLLSIPDRSSGVSLQKRLLIQFSAEAVFDAFNFLT